VPGGKGLGRRAELDLERAVRLAEQMTGLRFSVYVGALGDQPRARAEHLHSLLGEDAPYTVLVAVDPDAHRIEIVTGAGASRRLTDADARLAAITMTNSFVIGDLVGGIADGLRSLAEHTQPARVAGAIPS